jgi:hypothetical protein
MLLKIKHEVETEVEVNFPTYRKWASSYIKLVSETESIEIAFREHMDTVEYSHRQQKWYIESVLVAKASEEVTEGEFIAVFKKYLEYLETVSAEKIYQSVAA